MTATCPALRGARCNYLATAFAVSTSVQPLALSVDKEAPVGFTAIRLNFALETEADEDQLTTCCV
jgi:hypothetical protein